MLLECHLCFTSVHIVIFGFVYGKKNMSCDEIEGVVETHL